jgi:hypothetical protein
MKKINAYLILNYHNGNEYMDCGGMIVDEYGYILSQHHSSSFSFLELDLMNKKDINYNLYSINNLIGKQIPEDLINKINNKNK